MPKFNRLSATKTSLEIILKNLFKDCSKFSKTEQYQKLILNFEIILKQTDYSLWIEKIKELITLLRQSDSPSSKRSKLTIPQAYILQLEDVIKNINLGLVEEEARTKSPSGSNNFAVIFSNIITSQNYALLTEPLNDLERVINRERRNITPLSFSNMSKYTSELDEIINNLKLLKNYLSKKNLNVSEGKQFHNSCIIISHNLNQIITHMKYKEPAKEFWNKFIKLLEQLSLHSIELEKVA